LNRQESAIKHFPQDEQLQRGLKEQFHAFLCALQFLSALPVGKQPAPSSRLLGQAVTWYPLVGLCIGLLLCLSAWLLLGLFNSWISAALVLTLWVVLTGALHLDGLADSADAWLGGLGSSIRTLKIMKDPTSGPIAISTLILVLLLKLTALQALLSAGEYWALVWVLVFARCYAVLLLMHTPYVREKGFGSAPKEHLSEKHCYLLMSLLLIASLFSLSWYAVPVLLIGLAGAYGLRQLMMIRLQGCTGDTIGALIELSEVLLLLTLVACLV
jgi:adenosylcobinamide-GDP ribazoletransferase